MDFGIGGLFSAGGSVISGMMQAEEAAKTRDMNWAINVWNMQQRERERQEANALAAKLRGESKLGTTDIRGTTTKFVPGKGWVVTGAPALLAMMKAQDAEQMKQLEHDLPQRRKIMDRNYQRSFQDEALADTFRRQLVNTAPAASDAGYASDLYQAMTTGLREAQQNAGSRAYTMAARTNNMGVLPKMFQAQQKADNASYAQAALQAKLTARGTGVKEQAERRNQLSNLYNMFATRAAALPDTQYRPTPIDAKGDTALTMGQSGQGNQQAMQAAMMKGGNLDYISPNFGMANAVGGGAAALGSAFKASAAQRAYNGGGGGQQIAGFSGGYSGSGGDDGMYNEDQSTNHSY